MGRSVGILIFAGCSSLTANPAARAPPTAATPVEAPAEQDWSSIASSYPTSLRLAAEATVPLSVSTLCRLVIPGRDDMPYHADVSDTSIRVFVNELAWPAMATAVGDRSFAVGSVIVKAKTSGALGIMRKSQDGGWEYAYVDPAGHVGAEPAGVAHCAACHEHGEVPDGVVGVRLADPRDSVFLSASAP